MARPVPVWYGVIDKDGVFRPDAAGAWIAYRRTFANKRVEVTLKQWRKKATRKQHGWYRGMALPMIAEELGYQRREYDALHDAIMRELVGLKPDSDPRLNIRASTADFNTVEFTEQMKEDLQVWAATKLGLVLPDPDPNWKQKRQRGREAA